MIQKIILIGSGNVATHLGRKIQDSNYDIIQVISKKKDSAKKLAQEINTSFSNKINDSILSNLTEQAIILKKRIRRF